MFQFHGDIEYETPEYCKNIGKILNKPYIKAIGVKAGIDKSTNSDFIRDVYNKYINYENNNLFSGLLLDTKTSTYGGSGQSFDWEIIPKELLIKRDIPIIISGGINLDNLDLALSLNPYAVDLSSAIENDIKGIKDENKIKQIMQIIKNKRQNIAEIHDKL
jgi:phosphoribosylanthranilate isomerase